LKDKQGLRQIQTPPASRFPSSPCGRTGKPRACGRSPGNQHAPEGHPITNRIACVGPGRKTPLRKLPNFL